MLPTTPLMLALAVLLAAMPLSAEADTVVELLKRPGHVGLMRHALAPFEGAPREGHVTPDRYENCANQRNLDDAGRSDAGRIGQLFRARGLAFEYVFTSAWCRCRETADLVMGRRVENLPLIDSYYNNPDKTAGPRQLAGLKEWIGALRPDARALLITHGSLISDLTGIDTAESEIVVVVRNGSGGVSVVGRGVPIAPP